MSPIANTSAEYKLYFNRISHAFRHCSQSETVGVPNFVVRVRMVANSIANANVLLPKKWHIDDAHLFVQTYFVNTSTVPVRA